MHFNNHDKEFLNNLLLRIEKSSLTGLSTMEDLWMIADADSKVLVEKILQLDPLDFGFKGKKINEEPIPSDAIVIDNSRYALEGEYAFFNKAYVPRPIYSAFSKMGEKFTKSYPNRLLLVGSGYRSPAAQVVTLIYILAKVYDFDINKTLKRVALPQYSTHSSVSQTAIDIMNVDNEPRDDDPQAFKDSVEYAWLKEHAHSFNFYELYPPNNPDGIMWEPWHWQYVLNNQQFIKA
jgi:LAS superfamily LD-carboxypeptidase LdcB